MKRESLLALMVAFGSAGCGAGSSQPVTDEAPAASESVTEEADERAVAPAEAAGALGEASDDDSASDDSASGVEGIGRGGAAREAVRPTGTSSSAGSPIDGEEEQAPGVFDIEE